MNRDVLLGAGVVLIFIVLVNKAKKNQVTEPLGGGGGGGGGGFGPFGPMAPMPPMPPFPATTPLPSNRGQVLTPIFTKDTSPTRAVTNSTEAKSLSQISNLGGISSLPTQPTQRGSVIQLSKSDLEKGLAGNLAFKPFNGSTIDAKFLEFAYSKPKFEFN